MNIKDNILKDYSTIILAAGKSERLGFPKLSLKFNEQLTFIENIAAEYKWFGCKQIILVVNEKGKQFIQDRQIKLPENLRVVINYNPDWHRFYSLKLGVKSLHVLHHLFVHNVDNPFVNHQVLHALLSQINTADYISPGFLDKGGHPMLISKSIANDISKSEKDQVHLKEFLNQYTKLRVPVKDEKVLVNINTLAEYEKYFNFKY